MNTILEKMLVFPAALFAVLAGPATAAESTLHFSDPTQPGHLVVKLAFGNVEIVGAETSEVTVRSEVPAAGTETPREDGLRRLDSDNGFQVNEADNVITLSFGWFGLGGWKAGKTIASDVAITVPNNTAVTVERGGTGAVALRNLTGDVEIRGAIGDVELENMAGGVLLEATNGDIEASFVKLPEAKPVSITVVNGDVNVSVPSDARANVRLRTLRGEMLTDFSEEELESRFENRTNQTRLSQNRLEQELVYQQELAKRLILKQPRSVSEEQRTSEEDPDRLEQERVYQQELAKRRAAAEQQRGMAEATRAERAVAEQNRAASEAAKAAREAAEVARSRVETQVVVPSPNPIVTLGAVQIRDMPQLPPMAGGKLVVGTLNGGGTELLITTLTGTITLRKQE